MYAKWMIFMIILISFTCVVASFADQGTEQMPSPAGKELTKAQLLKLKTWRNEMEESEFDIYTRSVKKLMDLKLVLRKLSYASTIEATA